MSSSILFHSLSVLVFSSLLIAGRLFQVLFWVSLHTSSDLSYFTSLQCLSSVTSTTSPSPPSFYLAFSYTHLISLTMSSRNTWSQIPRNLSRRFTTLEGLREIGTGVYIAGAGGARVFSVRHQFDPERYDDDRTSWTAPARSDVESLHSSVSSRNWKLAGPGNESRALPHDSKALGMLEGVDGAVSGEGEGLSEEAMRIVEERRKTVLKEMMQEKPYHVFGKRKKWGVVVMIGVAGLFSGLSSNIYFPSLDAIAKASWTFLFA